MPSRFHVDPPEFDPPEPGMGRIYAAVLIIVAVLAGTGACILAQLLDTKVTR